jgi:hypothetical protein
VVGFLNEKRLFTLHYRPVGVSQLAKKLENAIAGGREPTQDELDTFADEWSRCRGVQAE